jgi:hypothetical protein
MRYLIILSDGSLAQLDALDSKLLPKIDAGEISIARFERDTFEYARVTSRAVDDPNNSFDETRQDQAIDGRIWEIDGWESMERYDVNTGEIRRADVQPITLIDDARVRKEFRDESESFEDRRARVLAEEKQNR